MGIRLELQSKLLELADYAYFEPSSSVKMHYPCFVYNLVKIRPLYANNKRYRNFPCYTVTYISLLPADNKVKEILDKFSYCHFSRPYMADSLHHYVFDIFF